MFSDEVRVALLTLCLCFFLFFMPVWCASRLVLLFRPICFGHPYRVPRLSHMSRRDIFYIASSPLLTPSFPSNTLPLSLFLSLCPFLSVLLSMPLSVALHTFLYASIYASLCSSLSQYLYIPSRPASNHIGKERVSYTATPTPCSSCYPDARAKRPC